MRTLDTELSLDAKQLPRQLEDAHNAPEAGAIWVRPRVAARMAGIGLTLLYSWINAGRVISKKVVGVRLILVSSLENIVADPGTRPGPRTQRRSRS